MKKTCFLLLFFISIGLNVFSQEHLTFKGIPIDGKLSVFVAKLIQQGFVFDSNTPNGDAAILKGTFAGEDDCTIYVSSTPTEHIVCGVAVFLPPQTSWTMLNSQYIKFRVSLISKYGTPFRERRDFISPYYEGDGYEMQAINQNKCDYILGINTQGGTIGLSISSDSYNSGKVLIIYQDEVNSKLKDSEMEQNMIDDL